MMRLPAVFSVILCATLLLPGVSFAAGKTYVGPFSGNWNNAANWDPAGVPGENEADNATLGTEVSFKSGPAVVDFDFVYTGGVLNILTLDATGSNSSITLRQSLASSAMQAARITVGETVARATYDQSAGSAAVITLEVGFSQNGEGDYKLSGGSLSVSGTAFVGFSGTGRFTQSGGMNTVGNVRVPRGISGNGTYTLSGSGVLLATVVNVGLQGTGVFTQSGGTNTVTADFLVGSSGGRGTYNLDGGVLDVPGIATNAFSENPGGESRFRFNGGWLRPRASNPNFYPGTLPPDQGLTEAIVKAGGANIDTNGFNIGIAQPLSHDPALGTNADGGLLKLGTGTLTLTGANTYTGTTGVSRGTLSVNNTSGSATGTGSVVVQPAFFNPTVTILAGGVGAGNGGVLNSMTRAYSGNVGKIAGTVQPTQGGIIAPGNNAVGTLTCGGLILSSTSVLNYELTASQNDFIAVTQPNALFLNAGGFNLYQPGTTTAFSAPGVYHLISYVNGIGLGAASNLTVRNPVAGRTYAFVNNSTLKTVDLVIEAIPVGLVSITKPTSGSVLLVGKGVPGAPHKILATNDISQPFNPTPIGMPTADSNGNFQFTDNTTLPRRFYRAVYP